MVLKKSQNTDTPMLTLAEQLAACDRQGYRQIVVSSVYLYPTEEHQQLLNVVAGFNQFSLSRIVATPAILQNVKAANTILTALSQHFVEPEVENLFIHHGVPDLANAGYHAIWYSAQLLAQLSPQNHSCSLEGASPFGLIESHVVQQLVARQPKYVRLIPMLLVSGNHFVNDVQEISATLAPHAPVKIATFVENKDFCLLDLPELMAALWLNIDTEFNKLGLLV